MPIKPRESKCLPQVFLFCSQRSLVCGWDCTTTTQLNTTQAKFFQLWASFILCFALWEISVHHWDSSKHQSGLSLLSPIFPVWNIHKKCPWTYLFWEPNRAHPHFLTSQMSKHPWRLSSVEEKHSICPEIERLDCILLYIRLYVNITILFK